jgi:hypothetical protein
MAEDGACGWSLNEISTAWLQAIFFPNGGRRTKQAVFA